jgi:hypothetical protein
MRANYREEYEGMEFYARMDPCLANQMYTNKTDTPCFLEFGEKACGAYSVRVMLLPDSMQWMFIKAWAANRHLECKSIDVSEIQLSDLPIATTPLVHQEPPTKRQRTA